MIPGPGIVTIIFLIKQHVMRRGRWDHRVDVLVIIIVI